MNQFSSLSETALILRNNYTSTSLRLSYTSLENKPLAAKLRDEVRGLHPELGEADEEIIFDAMFRRLPGFPDFHYFNVDFIPDILLL